MTDSPLLDARGVTKTFGLGRRRLFLGPRSEPSPVLHGVDLVMGPGEVTGLIGESGSGKTTFGKCLLRIVEPDGGSIHLDGEDWLAVSRRELQERRSRFQMIYQNPYACLNPGLTVGAHLRETLAVFRGIRGAQADEVAQAELARFGMQDKIGSYPGELSGGEKRRISVARALLTQPRLVVADEPTSGLDASVKADVLDAMLQAREAETAYLFISHDLDVIRFVSDKVLVMYRGRIVERMESDRLDPDLPHHPYTRRLFEAARADVPSADEQKAMAEAARIPVDATVGCPYRALCSHWLQAGRPENACATTRPELVEIAPRQLAACHVLAPDNPFPDDPPAPPAPPELP